MDGFDDLLPSRDALQNPFEDPFAKARSSSPDPWASFGQTVPSFNEESFAFGGNTSPTAFTHNAFADTEPRGFHDHLGVDDARPHDEEPPSEQESQHEERPDPLDTAAFNAAEAAAEAEEAAAQAANGTSRGFRESISTESEEPLKPSEPEPSAVASPIAEAPAKAPTPPPARRTSVAEVPNRTLGHVSRGSTASFSSQTLKTEPAAFNPLNQASTLERSIAGLSIGGEALGGWQGADGWQTQTHYAPPEPAARPTQQDSDSDDDDQPIAQTIAKRAASREAAQRAASVSTLNTLGLLWYQFHTKPSTSISSAPATKKENGIQPVFVITVDDPQRVGDPIRAYTMYTVHTKVIPVALSWNQPVD